MKKIFAMAALAVAALSANAQELSYDECVITPAQGEVSELSEIRIEYTSAYEVEVVIEEGVTLYHPDGNWVSAQVSVEENEDGNPNILVIKPNVVQTTPGEYELEISYGCVCLWSEYYMDYLDNEDDIYYHWTVIDGTVGVDQLASGTNAEGNVFDLQGRKVSANSKTAGIHVSNGKKIIVK